MSKEVSIDNEEVREALETVVKRTEYPHVKRIMERAIEILDDKGLETAAAHLVEEMAASKRAERQLLWAMPIVLITAMAFLFHALRALL